MMEIDWTETFKRGERALQRAGRGKEWGGQHSKIYKHWRKHSLCPKEDPGSKSVEMSDDGKHSIPLQNWWTMPKLSDHENKSKSGRRLVWNRIREFRGSMLALRVGYRSVQLDPGICAQVMLCGSRGHEEFPFRHSEQSARFSPGNRIAIPGVRAVPKPAFGLWSHFEESQEIHPRLYWGGWEIQEDGPLCVRVSPVLASY